MSDKYDSSEKLKFSLHSFKFIVCTFCFEKKEPETKMATARPELTTTLKKYNLRRE